jgi:phosphoribosylformylglycinamidine synthase
VSDIKRIYVEKKKGFDIEAQRLLQDLRDNLRIKTLKNLRLLIRYDISGISKKEYNIVKITILSEPPIDEIFEHPLKTKKGEVIFGIEYLPGQYDQRADSAAQCIQIVTRKKRPLVASARIFILTGELTDQNISKIKKYLINPVDSREAKLIMPHDLSLSYEIPDDIKKIAGFGKYSKSELLKLSDQLGLAMGIEDILFCQEYFRNEEKRDPTITEIKMLDTYWSDHCRHTTFHTRIDQVEIEEALYTVPIKEAFNRYKKSYELVNKNKDLDVSLMNIATMSMKEMREKGMLNDLEISGEVNACSIIREVIVNGKNEKWLILFKNETHNHPTEIEPFGGAATCLGGAIRDPLSGRAFVYQAMRVTGSGDPRKDIEETLPGKLPQKKITTEAALGYSSYGNQIGLATGMVNEIFHEGYVSKRMEVGAVIGAVSKKNIIREEPESGDVILLVGGRTGRDGIGGATGSSKKHTEKSIYTAGAEVQKGNPPEERKLQRLFRNPDVTRMIKKSNDFGAGGVSVAIGELAEGLEIDLDKVLKKYEGLDGTELALSESQERMAVVLSKEDVEKFKRFAWEENLEATVIARVNSSNRLKMFWRGTVIVDISRDFINTNGVRKKSDVFVSAPEREKDYFYLSPKNTDIDLKEVWLNNLSKLNICSQIGLVERFDSTIGAGSVLLPFGGKYQLTPVEAMVAKIPIVNSDVSTGTIMSYGFNPDIGSWSPFHTGVFSVVEAVARIVASGGDYRTIRFSLQEYFEKLGNDKKRWGKPFAALLGAYFAMTNLGLASIGGKDSMSGSFEDLHVPPTLIAFAVDTVDVNQVISPELKKANNTVVFIKLDRDQYECPDFEILKKNYSTITRNIKSGAIISAQSVKSGGIAEALCKMSFGNMIGFRFKNKVNWNDLFSPDYGSMIVELKSSIDAKEIFNGINYQVLGKTQDMPDIEFNDTKISLEDLLLRWKEPLEKVFPTGLDTVASNIVPSIFGERSQKRPEKKIASPRVLITVFPGTNCEYDTAQAFNRAGGKVDTIVFKNLNPRDINISLELLKKKINNSQIIVIPGGFSSGDEPDGSGKFIAAVFRNPEIQDAVMELVQKRDGLMLGICNGFQAFIKLGLVPFGEILDLKEDSPTLTFNSLGRHVSHVVYTKVVSVLSPWFIHSAPGDIHSIPVSHGEGRFVASQMMFNRLQKSGQIATQYVDFKGNPTSEIPFNPNGSDYAIEGITSPDGRIFGKMAHSERRGENVSINIVGNKDQKLFESGIDYFR